MDKFWKWMRENNYSSTTNITEDILDIFGNSMIPSHQMLAGYMIEYIREHEYWEKKITETELKYQARISGMRNIFCMVVFSDDIYFALRGIIDLIEITDPY